MELRIKNRYIVTLCRFLYQLPLGAKESRERVKFINACQPTIDALEAQRLAMAEKYADRDEDGNAIMLDNGTGTMTYDISPDAQKAFEKEFNELMEQDFTLSIDDGNFTKVKTVKDLVLNTDQKLAGPLATEYEAWCEAMEALEL